VFTALIIIGIIIVYILFVLFAVNIIVAQLISLFLVSLMGLALAYYYFKKAEAKEEKGIEPKLPKMSVTIYNTMPYFVYGILYFTFLFVDRLMAWSVDNAYLPYLIWFRGDYELGLDFSLLVLIIPMGINEVVLHKFMTDIQSSQKRYLGQDYQKMNNHYITEYMLRVVVILIVSIVSAVWLYFSVEIIMDYFNPEMGEVIYHNRITHFVFIASLIAYVFLAIALMNAVTLFSLSQPHKVIKSIVPALLVNVIAGFVLSRWFGYEYAVLGLLAASIVFMVLSWIQVPLSFNEALKLVEASAGAQLDEKIVQAFIQWFKKKRLNPSSAGRPMGTCSELLCVPSSICKECPVSYRRDVPCWEVENNLCEAHGKKCNTCMVRTEYITRRELTELKA
jgi:hypothetical protein